MRWVISISVVCMGAVLLKAQAYQQSEEAKPAQTQQTESSGFWSRSVVDSIFVFSNGKSICLGAAMWIEEGNQVLSAIDLRDCDNGDDLVVRFLGELRFLDDRHVSFRNDTLWVNQVELLAKGENLELVYFPWKNSAFYIEDDSFGYTEGLNENLRYDQQTIESVLEKYEATELRTQEDDAEYVSFHLMDLANKLLIAAVSGSPKAEVYFKEFKTRVKPDGANGSWYRLMERILNYASARQK